MQLKALRLLGFKSFAQKTEFTFPDGITCIVGPNGCGKSNVVDAIKWVLGEQRPTALRGKEMADVIFGGTSRRKPLGMAEVTLVFDNSARVLDVDWTEVEISRRVYRDGTGEYLLNKTRCRLKDIRELFMDTGSGPGAMTIMEQGRIDEILRDSHQERRQVFEEAAGISRYKARRKESVRRLDRVESDLLRISDVVTEKQRLVRSLKIQAGRAERYQALIDEMRRKRLSLAVHRYGHLLGERESATVRVGELSEAEDAARDEVRDALAACRSVEDEVETARSEMSRLEAEIAKLEGRGETAREKAAFAARMVAELDGKIRWYAGEIESTAERLEELRGLRRDAGAAASAAESERDERRAAVDAAEAALAAASAGLEHAREEERQAAARGREALGRQNELAARRSRLEAELGAVEGHVARLDARLAGIGEEAAASGARLAAARAARETAAGDQEEALAALAAGVADTTRLGAALEVARERVGELDRDVSACRTRVDVLESLCQSMEGVGEGARALLEAARDGRPELAGVRGLLAELVRTDAKDAAVVESALGAYATAIVVETFDDVERAADYLRAEQLGSCVLLPLDAVHASAERAGAAAAAAGGTPVLERVGCDAELRPALEALLSGVVHVDTLAEARVGRAAIDPDARGGVQIVTTAGETLLGTGAVRAGGKAGGAGVLQRRSELRELSVRLEQLVRELEESRAERRDAEAELERAHAAVEEARRLLRQAESVLHVATAEEESAAEEAARLEVERARLRGELDELSGGLEKLRSGLSAASEETAQLAAEHDRLETEHADATRAFREAERLLREAQSTSADARVQMAAVSERCASLLERRAALEQEAVDLEQGVDEAREELAGCERRRVEALQRGEQAHVDLEAARDGREACVLRLAEVRAGLGERRTQLEERRSLAEQLETEAAGVGRELQRFRLRENEARLRVENLMERIQEELEVDLHAAWEAHRRPDADAESVPVYVENEDGTEPFDADALESEVVQLKDKISRMGAVNLEALEQLQSAESEASELLTQHDDLTRSRASLLEAIRRIDQESRQLFETTFENIRKNFREMFRRMFGGGRADILLEEGQDILEAGVEIVARPPGKELRSISLLSGGERTMTAVALLFAIYQAHPSPFCLLDEVDAALDESNIDRFIGVLSEFAQDSQFMIISHNKRTMGVADTIVGVSMPEAGVSRKIAVRLDQIAEDGEIRAA